MWQPMYRTIHRWIFSVRKLIFWWASSKITLVFPSPKTNLLSDLPKNYFLETQFSVEFRFSMAVSRSLGNSPNDSNSPLTFSSVIFFSNYKVREYTPEEVAMIERASQDNAIKRALKLEATKVSTALHQLIPTNLVIVCCLRTGYLFLKQM